MIVAPRFDGDVDEGLMLMQHESYSAALGLMLDAHNRFAHFIDGATGGSARGWSAVTSCDHRTLQQAHDILAAAWRYRTDVRQAQLSMPGSASLCEPSAAWLDWLRGELTAWFDEPRLVCQLHEILVSQNRPAGYVAESRLAYSLVFDRLSEVPWSHEEKDAVTKALDEDEGPTERRAGEP